MAEIREFSDVQSALNALTEHEIQTNNRYAVYAVTKDFGHTDLTKCKRVSWEDRKSTVNAKVKFSGVPFVVLGSKRLDCQFGKDRKKKFKEKRAASKQEHSDHKSYAKGKKFIVQDTKKLECQARCLLREICYFPSYKIDADASPTLRKMFADDILCRIHSGEDIEYERQIVASFPDHSEHTCHSGTEVVPEPIDSRLVAKIKELCDAGVFGLADMRARLQLYVQEICDPSQPSCSKRFLPSDKIIGNHMFKYRQKGTSDDQQNLAAKYGSKFLFVHQSVEQRRLMQRYGGTIFLDATYKSTLYDIPLFFLAVKTNVDYQIIATFVTEDETTASISEALTVLKRNWGEFATRFFLTDFDESEISAIEHVFPGTTVLICDFHRNQAWERWTKKKENSLGQRDDILKMLRKMANASTETAFNDAVAEMQQTLVWQNNAKLQHYVQKIWLPQKMRWSRAFRSSSIDLVAATNNGLESHHRIFKTSFLNRSTTNRLSNMLSILIENFLPSRYRKYCDQNVLMTGKYRKYSSNIPMELQHRPRPFIKHCMERLDSAKDIDRFISLL